MKFNLRKYFPSPGSETKSTRLRIYRTLRRFLIGFILVSLLNGIFSIFFDTPKMSRIRRRNEQIERQYRILNDKILAAERTIDDIKHRDNYVYRPLLGIDTLDMPGVYREYPESKYASLDGDRYSPLMTDTWRRLDRLTRRMYLASVSLDATQDLAENKELFSAVIPAIWPIDRTKLKYVSDLYGWRMHPKYHVWKFHEGIDLAAPTGTPVYATGNGIVSESKTANGYGKVISINHGFGYTSRYAHLSKQFVVRGDSVTRGQVIGEVGATGVGTGPHLHYEVRYMGSTVNPINYFNKDMSAESYIDLVEQLNEKTVEQL